MTKSLSGVISFDQVLRWRNTSAQAGGPLACAELATVKATMRRRSGLTAAAERPELISAG
jgi:hypothetical protein